MATKRSTKSEVGGFQLRHFPAGLRDLLVRTAKHLKIDREQLLATLLKRELAKPASIWAEIESREEELRKWYNAIEREDVE